MEVNPIIHIKINIESMKTSSETTNQQNVINFELLITVITTFGDKYNPPVEVLSIPTLSALMQKGKLS